MGGQVAHPLSSRGGNLDSTFVISRFLFIIRFCPVARKIVEAAGAAARQPRPAPCPEAVGIPGPCGIDFSCPELPGVLFSARIVGIEPIFEEKTGLVRQLFLETTIWN